MKEKPVAEQKRPRPVVPRELPVPEARPAGGPSPAVPVRLLIPWKERLRVPAAWTSWANLKTAARGTLLASVLFFSFSLGYAWLGPRAFRLPPVAAEKLREEDYVLPADPRPFDQYAQAARQHRIFSALASAEGDQAIIASDSNMVKDLSLLGIIGDTDPQAIIEDKRSHETYYVKKGKMIGDMQVEDILQGKVIIQYGGEHYELSL